MMKLSSRRRELLAVALRYVLLALIAGCGVTTSWALDGWQRECIPLNEADPPRREIAHGTGLLFEVRNKPAPASHVFATIHLVDKRVTTLPGPVRQALTNARNFVMEALFDPAAIAELSLLMVYSDGTRLEAQIGRQWFAPAAELLAGQGIPAPLAGLLKPWAAYLTLSMPPPTGELPLDFRLMEDAQNRGVPVHGLENVAEQTAALSGLSAADQIALLKAVICHYDEVQASVENSVLAYLDRDLAALAARAEHYRTEDEKLHQRLLDSLITKRNVRMVERMLPHLRDGHAFVAVGALHLPGKQGILRLLEQRGYAVTVRY